ncbi:helix-turn-helix domain-containing protein [Bacillus anthracis]
MIINKAQTTLVNKTIGCSRCVYNYILTLWSTHTMKQRKGV